MMMFGRLFLTTLWYASLVRLTDACESHSHKEEVSTELFDFSTSKRRGERKKTELRLSFRRRVDVDRKTYLTLARSLPRSLVRSLARSLVPQSHLHDHDHHHHHEERRLPSVFVHDNTHEEEVTDVHNHPFCATPSATKEEMLHFLEVIDQHKRRTRRLQVTPSFTIPVNFVDVFANTTESNNQTQADREAIMDAKIADLNADFADGGCIEFVRNSYDYVVDPDWHDCSQSSSRDPFLEDMGNTYDVQNKPDEMFVFICDVGFDGGYASLPYFNILNGAASSSQKVNAIYIDTDVIDSRYVLPHEAGHWLGKCLSFFTPSDRRSSVVYMW